ncbi:MAG: transaldolase [Elusimicrobia bacterium CG08_land_8_20_14_0_20_51_18]|nr:MAG: transaldolase [Elusimicrobia bacterium CG08_land_8_20_14_0_20_51_18]
MLALRGKAAVSSCLLAYKKYLEFFYSERFSALAAKGFRPQKILWASTSAKNPAYSDTIYLDALCLAGSVITVPENTIAAFDEHGDPEAAPPETRYAQAAAELNALKDSGVNFDFLLSSLQKDGLEKFSASHNNLVALLENKKKEIRKMQTNEKFKQEIFGTDLNAQADLVAASGLAQRLWKKDASLWKTEPDHVKNIKNSLGWLDIPYKMLARAGEIEKFAESVRKEGFKNVVILGMGGSSLAPEVFRSLFQKNSHPKMFVLDTTNPDWIASTRKNLDLKRTLFLFSSKSGGTVEPNSQFRYFWAELKKEGVKKPGDHFIAITDKNTSLEALALKKDFRRVFINPSDIGGRFSALSYFGLIPAALCGADIRKLLERAVETADACQKNDFHGNPGVFLGAAMANGWSMGRDKLTVVLPKKMKALGLWIEQLVAESTGKEGKGIVPVCEDGLRPAGEYQKDRFFVVLNPLDFRSEEQERAAEALVKNGHPLLKLYIKDFYDLGGEFFRWETATAAAGFFMKINPFDQPNVQESKTLTVEILKKLAQSGKLTETKPDFDSDKVSIHVSKALKKAGSGKINNYSDIFWEIFSALGENEYFSVLAYAEANPKNDLRLAELAEAVRRYTASASFYSYGPRYLHSTGQLFKGGKDNGVFLILTTKPKKDIKIAGEKYTFCQLTTAQAIGDFRALESKNRRVIRVHLKKSDFDACLKYVTDRIVEVGEKKASPETTEEKQMIKLAEKKTTKTTKRIETTSNTEYIVMDYPKNLETITARYYAVRIGASDCVNVEVSINDQPWQNCRRSVGYWWYDWTNIQPGTYQILARMNKGNGQYLMSKRRRCKII